MLLLSNFGDNNWGQQGRYKIFLDADFRKEPNYSHPYCCRCQKPVDVETAIKVTTDGYQEVNIGGNGYNNEQEYIGADCARKIGLK